MIAEPIIAARLPITSAGLISPDPSRPLSRHHWADAGLAAILEAKGNPFGARAILDMIEQALGVTAHDRFVAEYGPQVAAGRYPALNRAPAKRQRVAKAGPDPAVLTSQDRKDLAKADRLLRSTEIDVKRKGRELIDAVSKRRDIRIEAYRAEQAASEAKRLETYRDNAVVADVKGRMRRVDGLELLKSAGSIDHPQYLAARHYGRLYVSTEPRSAIRSCLNDDDGSRLGVETRTDAELAVAATMARDRHQDRMAERCAIERSILAATGARTLLLVQQVAGQGASIRSLAASGPMNAVFRRDVVAGFKAIVEHYGAYGVPLGPR